MELLGFGDDMELDCVYCGDWIYRDGDGIWRHGDFNNTTCRADTEATPDQRELAALTSTSQDNDSQDQKSE